VIWREGQVADLAARSLEAGAAIDTQLGKRRVDLGDAAAWGQFVDEDHYSPDQWGLFGTSAAVRTLSLRADPPLDVRHIRDGVRLLPRDRNAFDPRLQKKVDKGDLQNIIRLAFVAEALEPGRDDIPAGDRPPIVSEIVALARGEPYWSPTSAVRGAPQAEGDVFTTAYVLYALRRYENPIGELRAHRLWLASQLEGQRKVRVRPDLVALVGLAMLPRAKDPHDPQPIKDGLERCKQELLGWQRREPSIVLHRPLFQGFNFGSFNDYVFLHPEIVASLFLLQAGSPRRTRRFVAHVVGELVENIEDHGYFEGRPGMGATVDQMWGSQLLDVFYEIHAEEHRRHLLMPPWIATARMRWIVVIAAAVGFALVAFATSSLAGGAAGAGAGVVISLAMAMLIAWAKAEK
jgi:hypothetical protein